MKKQTSNLNYRYTTGLRLLFYRYALIGGCLTTDIVKWKLSKSKKKTARDNLLKLLQTEFTYLHQNVEAVVCSLPTIQEDTWISPELEQWLLITHDIAEIGCDDKRYKKYFNLQTFTAEACELGELAFKLIMQPVIYFMDCRLGKVGFCT
jgi:hypothetical protein